LYLTETNLVTYSLYLCCSLKGSTILLPRLLRKYGPQYVRNSEVKDAKRKSEALLCFKESASCSASHATCSKANSSGTCTKENASFWVRARVTCNSLLKLKIFLSSPCYMSGCVKSFMLWNIELRSFFFRTMFNYKSKLWALLTNL
jgi:hypothetical protein